MLKKVLLISALFLLFLINSCKETINEPCGDNIKITIVTKYHNCDNVCDNLAEESKISITQTSGTNTVLLDTGTTVKAQYIFTPLNSGCGIGNLSIVAGFQDKYFESVNLDYVCKDTTIEICIEVDCDTVPPSTCNSLGKVDSLIFIDDNSGEKCIPINSPNANSYYSRKATYTNGSSENMVIRNLRSVINYNLTFQNGKFRYTPMVPLTFRGTDYVLTPNTSVRLDFQVLTDNIGSYQDKLVYDVICEGNPNVVEKWEINLKAEVCETPCDCPNDGSKAPELKVTSGADYLQQGDEKQFNNLEVLKIGSTTLQSGCYLTIKEIVRIDDKGNEYATRGWINNPYQINNGNPEDDWTITTLAPYSAKISAGGSFKLNVKVGAVKRSGYLRDTFRIKTSVYDKNGVLKDNGCNFSFYLEGRGCGNECAEIVIPQFRDGVVNEVNTNNLIDIWDKTKWTGTSAPSKLSAPTVIPLISYYNSKEVFFDFTTTFSEDAACKSTTPKLDKLTFNLRLPSNVEHCKLIQNYKFEVLSPYPSNLYQNYQKDLKFFTYYPTNSTNISQNGTDVIISFKAPTPQEFRDLKNVDPTKSTFKYRLSIRDNEDNRDCHIILNIQATLDTMPLPGPVRQLYAYSQTTPKQTNPDYFAIRIDEPNTDGYWGADKNQVTSSATNPNVPDSDDSFFINVTAPQGVPGQVPLLNLVPKGTVFSNIKLVSGYSFTTQLAFDNGYRDLINSLFTNNSFNLNPGRLANTFTGINGIPVKMGDVYAVWSTSTYGSNNNPCHLALIYILEAALGTEVGNVSDITNIRYRLIYPIYK
jgi:hypothetical protein